MVAVSQLHRPIQASHTSGPVASAPVRARVAKPAHASSSGAVAEPPAPRAGDTTHIPRAQHAARDVSRGPLFARDRLVLGLDEGPRALREQESRYLEALPTVVPAMSAEELQVMRALAARLIVSAVQVGEITDDCLSAVNFVVKGQTEPAAREQKIDALLAVTRDLVQQMLSHPGGTDAERARAAALPARELWRVAKGEYVPPHMLPLFERGLREDKDFARRLPDMLRSRVDEVKRTEPTFAGARYLRALAHAADVAHSVSTAVEHGIG